MQKNRIFLLLFFFVSTNFFLISCAKKNEIKLQGYIEGKYTYLASGVPGTLISLNVKRGEQVQTGQKLYILDLQPETAQLQQAQQQLAQAITNAKLSLDNLNRTRGLYLQKAIDQASYERASLTYQADTQKIEQLKASITQSEWQLSQKQVSAPAAGYIFDTYFRIGEYVNAQQPVISMLMPQDIKLIFYIPEPLRSKVKVGDEITFNCDSCGQNYRAKIDFISPQAEYTPPVIYSRESREKLVFRVEAILINNTDRKFYPGIPVDVYIQN